MSETSGLDGWVSRAEELARREANSNRDTGSARGGWGDDAPAPAARHHVQKVGAARHSASGKQAFKPGAPFVKGPDDIQQIEVAGTWHPVNVDHANSEAAHKKQDARRAETMPDYGRIPREPAAAEKPLKHGHGDVKPAPNRGRF